VDVTDKFHKLYPVVHLFTTIRIHTLTPSEFRQILQKLQLELNQRKITPKYETPAKSKAA
jgi:hypothetical protein